MLLEDPSDPETVVARIEGAMTVPVRVGSAEVRVRTSVGVAHAVGAGDGTDQLVSDADHAMYRVKQRARAVAPTAPPPPCCRTRPAARRGSSAR